MTRVEMLYDRLLIEPIGSDEQVTPGGIILPPIEQQSTIARYGIVHEVGHGRVAMDGKVVPTIVKQGDVIMWARTTDGSQFSIPSPNGQMCSWLVIQEPHVIAIMHGAPRRSALVDVTGALGTLS